MRDRPLLREAARQKKLYEAIRKSGGKALVVEDHYPEGGVGEAVARELSEYKLKLGLLSVNKMPCSGKMEELLAYEGIDSASIVAAAKKLLKR